MHACMCQNAGGNLPLSQQVRLFAATRAAMEAKVGARAVAELLSRSFFLVGVGSNDFFAFATAQAKGNSTAVGVGTQSDVVAAFYGSLVSNYAAAITVRHASMCYARTGIFLPSSIMLYSCMPCCQL
jgi:hypothetical protein